jgi:hypothetical protein
MGYTLTFIACDFKQLNDAFQTTNSRLKARLTRNGKEADNPLLNHDYNTVFKSVFPHQHIEKLCSRIYNSYTIDYETFGYKNYQTVDDDLELMDYPNTFRIQTLIGQCYDESAEYDTFGSLYPDLRRMNNEFNKVTNQETTWGFVSPNTLKQAREYYRRRGKRDDESGEPDQKRAKESLSEEVEELLKSIHDPHVIYAVPFERMKPYTGTIEFLFKWDDIPEELGCIVLSFLGARELCLMNMVSMKINKLIAQHSYLNKCMEHVGIFGFFE